MTFDQTSHELRRMIDDRLGADRVHNTSFTWYRDHAGEPAISLGVTMKAAKDIPDAKLQNELTHSLSVALAEWGDPGFPYLYFDALDDEKTPDDVDEFEWSPES